MKNSVAPDPETPRVEYREPFVVAGTCERYRYADMAGIPAQWQKFGIYVGGIPARVGQISYGVMLSIPGDSNGFDYLTGTEVSGLAGLPEPFDHAHIPGGRYAVFEHRGPASGINAAWNAAWSESLPQSGWEVVDSPVLFEQYGDDFDSKTASGVVELWIPIKE